MDGRRSGRIGLVAAAWMGIWWTGPVQAQPPRGAPAVGNGVRIVPSVAAPWAEGGGVVMGGGTSAGGGGIGLALMDPVAMTYLYGVPFPVSQRQAGLLMLSQQQRMLGLGSGQLSGVRPMWGSMGVGGFRPAEEPARTAAHTANMNIPGGQAARFFNRGTGPVGGGETSDRGAHPYYPRRPR